MAAVLSVIAALSAAWASAADTPTCTGIEALPKRTTLRHVAAPRETLDQIAWRYGALPSEVRERNGIPPDIERLRRGTRIEVRAHRRSPPRERIAYVVREGDTWWKVAVAHGVDSHDLRAYNWPYRDKMKPGRELAIWIDPVLHAWVTAAGGDGPIRDGAVGIGAPGDGRLLNGIALPVGPGLRLRHPSSAYGTTHAVAEAVRALELYRAAIPDAQTLMLGSMSRQRGGPLGGHLSHQTGRDLDIALPRKAGVSPWKTLTRHRIDWPATWALVRALGEVDAAVVYLDYGRQRWLHAAAREAGATDDEVARLMQYPRGSAVRRGLVRHADGHTGHLHVRFRCGPCETECVDRSEEPEPP